MDTGRAPLSQLPQRIPAHSSAWAAAGPRACAPRPRGATRLPRRLPPARPPAQAANSSEAWRGATGRQATAGRAARAEGGAGRVGRRPAREESAPRLEAPPARRRRPVPGRACCQGQSPAARQARPVAAGRTRGRAARRPGRGGGSERPGEARRAKGRAGRAPTAAAPAVPGSTTRRPPAGELTPCVAASVGGCRALVGPGVVVSAGRRPAGGGLGESRGAARPAAAAAWARRRIRAGAAAAAGWCSSPLSRRRTATIIPPTLVSGRAPRWDRRAGSRGDSGAGAEAAGATSHAARRRLATRGLLGRAAAAAGCWRRRRPKSRCGSSFLSSWGAACAAASPGSAGKFATPFATLGLGNACWQRLTADSQEPCSGPLVEGGTDRGKRARPACAAGDRHRPAARRRRTVGPDGV